MSSAIADSVAGAASEDAPTVISPAAAAAVAASSESSVPCAADAVPIASPSSSSASLLQPPLANQLSAASAPAMGQIAPLGQVGLPGALNALAPPSAAQINAILEPFMSQMQQMQAQAQAQTPASEQLQQQPPQLAGSMLLFPPGSAAWNLAASLVAQGVDLSALTHPLMDPLPPATLAPSTLQLISAVTRTPGLKQQAKAKSRKKKQQGEQEMDDEEEQEPQGKSRGRDRARAAAAPAAAAAAAADSKPPEKDPPVTLSASGRPQRSAALRRKRVLSDDDSYDDEKDAPADEDEEEPASEADSEADEEDELAGASEDEAYAHESPRKRSHRSATQRKKTSASKRSSASGVNRRAPLTRVLADQQPPDDEPRVKQEPEADAMQGSNHAPGDRRDLADAEMDPTGGSDYTGGDTCDDSSREHSLSRGPRMATPAHGRPFAVADEEGMFNCHLCHVRFGRNSNLTRHLRIHEAVKRFKCPRPGCDKEFMEKHHLEAHDRTHTGDRPFTCPVAQCARTFTDRSNCSRHIKTHGPDAQRLCPITTPDHTPTRGPHKKPKASAGPAAAGAHAQRRQSQAPAAAAARSPASHRGVTRGTSMQDDEEQGQQDACEEEEDGMGRYMQLPPSGHSPSDGAGGFGSPTGGVRQSSRARVAKQIAPDHVESWTDEDRSEQEQEYEQQQRQQQQQQQPDEQKHDPNASQDRSGHQQQQQQQQMVFGFDAHSAVHASYHVLASPEPAIESQYADVDAHHLVPASADTPVRRDPHNAQPTKHRSGGSKSGGSSSHHRRRSHKRSKHNSAAASSPSLVNLLDAAEAMTSSSASSGASASHLDPPPLQLQVSHESLQSGHSSPSLPPMQRASSCNSDSLTQMERSTAGAPSTPQRHSMHAQQFHNVSPISAASMPHTPSGAYGGSCSLHSPSKHQTLSGSGGLVLPLSPPSPRHISVPMHNSGPRVSSPSLQYQMPMAHPHSQAQMFRPQQGHTMMQPQQQQRHIISDAHQHQQQQQQMHLHHLQLQHMQLQQAQVAHEQHLQQQQQQQQQSWHVWMQQQLQRQHHQPHLSTYAAAAASGAAHTQPAASGVTLTPAEMMP